jgi:hypothetical protein
MEFRAVLVIAVVAAAFVPTLADACAMRADYEGGLVALMEKVEAKPVQVVAVPATPDLKQQLTDTIDTERSELAKKLALQLAEVQVQAEEAAPKEQAPPTAVAEPQS